MQETWVWSLGREDPWRREWQPTPVFLPGEFYGQKSLASNSLCGHKESDTNEWLTHAHTHTHEETEAHRRKNDLPETNTIHGMVFISPGIVSMPETRKMLQPQGCWGLWVRPKDPETDSCPWGFFVFLFTILDPASLSSCKNEVGEVGGG